MSACNKPEVVEPVELAVPNISQVNDTTIGWVSVENAIAYDLDINGIISQVTATQHQVTSYGTYVFKVRAKSAENSNFLNSKWSNAFTLVYAEPLPTSKTNAPIDKPKCYLRF